VASTQSLDGVAAGQNSDLLKLLLERGGTLSDKMNILSVFTHPHVVPTL